MAVLRNGLIVVVLLVAAILIVSNYTQKEYEVERQIIVEKPMAVVFNYLKHLKNQEHYAARNRLDPQLKYDYQGSDGQAGCVVRWDGAQPSVGRGEQEIISLVEGQRIELELRYDWPTGRSGHAYLATEPGEDGTTIVHWRISNRLDAPKNLLLFVVDMEKKLANELEESIYNLRIELEKLESKK